MDREPFDALTRRFVATPSRRAALGALLGAGFAGSLTTSEAKKKRRKKRCKPCRGKAQGESCLTNKECCANETHLACAFTNGGGPVCCGVGGAPCGVDGDCCLGFECFAGDRCVFLV